MAYTIDDTLRLDSLADFGMVFDFDDSITVGGAWQADSSGSTGSNQTGPGTNSGGPYVFTEASGTSVLSELETNSAAEILAAVMSAWTGTGRVLALRASIAGYSSFDRGGGLMVEGRADSAHAWSQIELLEGWEYSNSYIAGGTLDDNTDNSQDIAQDGGWVDFSVTIPDSYTEVRIRIEVQSGAAAFRHDMALWNVQLLAGGVSDLMPVALAAVRDIVVNVNETVSHELPEATDAGSSPTAAVTGLPTGVTFDGSSRELGGRTDDLGPHWITYTVTRSDSKQATRRFVLAVLPITKEWLGGQTPTSADLANHINTPIAYNAGRLGVIYKPAPIKLPDSPAHGIYYLDENGAIREIEPGNPNQMLVSGGSAHVPFMQDILSAEKLSWPTTPGGTLNAPGFGITATVSHSLARPPLVVGLAVRFTEVDVSSAGYPEDSEIQFPMGWVDDFAYPRIIWATDAQVKIETPDFDRAVAIPHYTNDTTVNVSGSADTQAVVFVYG